MEEDFMKMNSDGYDEQYQRVCHGIENSHSNVKLTSSNGDRICNTCNKEDVCMNKAELAQAAKEITQISERVNVFIDTDIRCKKWSGKVVNTRDNIPLEERIKWLEEDYVTGKGR